MITIDYVNPFLPQTFAFSNHVCFIPCSGSHMESFISLHCVLSYKNHYLSIQCCLLCFNKLQ